MLILKITEPCLYHYNSFPIVLNDTGSSGSILLNGVGICVTRFHRPLHLSPEAAHLLSSLHLPPSSLHVRRSACAEMTGFSQRYDTFGSLFSPSRSLFLSRRADGPRLPLVCVERRTHSHFFTNRKCFESAVGFLMAPRINSGEPACLSHMIQHPLINATQCCVTKSQLHHAPSD